MDLNCILFLNLQLEALGPDFFFIILGLLESLSFLATSLILFRILAVLLAVGYIILANWTGLDAPGIKAVLMGGILDICLNVFMIAKFILERSVFSIPVELVECYQESFSKLKPFEFIKIVKSGEIISIDDRHEDLVTEGSEFEYLYYILGGSANVRGGVTNNLIALNPGDWIGEMSFVSHKKTSASVFTSSIRALRWTRAKLSVLKKDSPEIYDKLFDVIASNICSKLCRATESNSELQQSIDNYIV